MWLQLFWVLFLCLMCEGGRFHDNYCDCEEYPYSECCQEENEIGDSVNDDQQCGVMGGSRIYGGLPAAEGDLPWMAVLYYDRRNEPHCGASIITRWFLLTAAHCVAGDIVKKIGQPWYARLGVQNLSTASSPEDIYSFQRAIPHPEYNERSVNRASDIGLLMLDRQIYYHDFVRPVCLPERMQDIITGTILTVAGWGKTPLAYYNDQKLKTTLRVLDRGVCNKAYEKSRLTLGHNQLCTGGSGRADTCRGDSGNGLYEERQGVHYIQGVVSFGPSACGTEKWPSISTNVAWIIDWIDRYIEL